jgi:AraC-like DNA-binding protein
MDTEPAYQFLRADAHPVIEGVWTLASGPGDDRIAPDTRCEIIFHLGQTPEEKTLSGWQVQPAQMIYGPLTRVLELKRTSPMNIMAIRLKPQGIGALVDNPRALRNRSCALADCLPNRVINELWRATNRDLDHVCQVAQSTLEPTLAIASTFIRIAEAVETLQRAPSTGVSELADSMRISRRTLDRDFMRYTGLTPGEFARINRYQAAHAAIREGALALSDIAVLSGYSDQAHMTREFRRLAGLTPRRKRNREGLDVFYEDVASSST